MSENADFRILGLRASGGPLFRTSLPIRPGLTVLYGRNGAGKSWILDCLYACLVGTRTRIDGRELPADADAALLVESALDRSEGLKAFFGANPDDRLEMFAHPELVAAFREEVTGSHEWAFCPGWSVYPGWNAYIAITPRLAAASEVVFEDDQALKQGMRAVYIGDYAQARKWLERAGIGGIFKWDPDSGVPSLVRGGSEEDLVAELEYFVDEVAIFNTFVGSDGGVPVDLYPLDRLDGLPIPLNHAATGADSTFPHLDVKVIVESPDSSSAVDVQSVLAGGPLLLRTDAGWLQFPPDDLDVEDEEAASEAPQIPPETLRLGLSTMRAHLVVRAWGEQVAAVANGMLRRFLMDPPVIELQISDRAQSVFSGQMLDWTTDSGLRIDALSRAERRWAQLAIRLAVQATTHSVYADTPLDHPDDVLRLDGPTFVILDEPEAALHRAAESHMAEGLLWLAQQPNACVVTATHSPNLLDSLGSAIFRVHPVEHEIVEDGHRRILRGAQVSELTAVNRSSMPELGLQPSDLLQRSRAFLLVEGLHDEIVLNELIGTELEKLHVVVLPLRGATQLPSVLDSRFLFDFSEAVIIPILDNISPGPMIAAWQEAVVIAATNGPDAAGAHIRKALPTKRRDVGNKRATENKFLGEFLSRAIEMGVDSRVKPFSFSAPDIVHYLPVDDFVDKRGATWGSLWQEHADALEAHRTREESAKPWIEATYRTKFYAERVEEAARKVKERPAEFDDLLDYIELAVGGLLPD